MAGIRRNHFTHVRTTKCDNGLTIVLGPVTIRGQYHDTTVPIY